MVVALAASALVMTPLLYFGAFALRTSLIDLSTRLDAERTQSAQLAAGLVAGSMRARADLLRLFVTRQAVQTALSTKDGAALSLQLEDLVAGHEDVASAAAFTAAGTLITRVPDDPAVVGLDFSGRDYFRGATASSGEPFVSEVFASAALAHPTVVAVSTPVRASGAFLGVLNLTVLPAQLLRDVSAVTSQSGRELLVLDGRSQVVASTTGRTPLASVSLAPAPSATASTVDLEGSPRTYVSAPIAGTSWTLYVLDDPALVYSAQRELLREIGGPLFVAMVGAALLAAIVAIAYLLIRREREQLALANAQLVELNHSVEAATRAKSDFLASMSHELRTPLNAVLGFSDVLREQLGQTLSDRQRRYLDNIHAAGSHLLELINDVLDLSKVEAGRLVLRPEPIPLSDLLEPVVATAAQLATDRGVRFEPEPVPLGVAYVDAARVRQVLLNLLSNAVKFTNTGGLVGLRISVSGKALGAEVTDSGIGIPPDQRGRVFGMFERLHEGRIDATGTGLGLAITKRLVELHHGTIDFESEPGRGTRFYLSIPDAIIEPEIGPRVLVVEDDTRDADLLSELAHEAGLRVEIAPTAASALAAIARSAPTAVILDLRLPDRRGDEVLVALKSDPRTARIPVLVVTVEDDDGVARVHGADDHMTKPIETERVRRWLRRAVAGGVADARAVG